MLNFSLKRFPSKPQISRILTSDMACSYDSVRNKKIKEGKFPNIFKIHVSSFNHLEIMLYIQSNNISDILSAFSIPTEMDSLFFEANSEESIKKLLTAININAQIVKLNNMDFVSTYCDFPITSRLLPQQIVRISNRDQRGNVAKVLSINSDIKKAILQFFPKIDYTNANSFIDMSFDAEPAPFDRNKLEKKIGRNLEKTQILVNYETKEKVDGYKYKNETFVSQYQIKIFDFNNISVWSKLTTEEKKRFGARCEFSFEQSLANSHTSPLKLELDIPVKKNEFKSSIISSSSDSEGPTIINVDDILNDTIDDSSSDNIESIIEDLSSNRSKQSSPRKPKQSLIIEELSPRIFRSQTMSHTTQRKPKQSLIIEEISPRISRSQVTSDITQRNPNINQTIEEISPKISRSQVMSDITQRNPNINQTIEELSQRKSRSQTKSNVKTENFKTMFSVISNLNSQNPKTDNTLKKSVVPNSLIESSKNKIGSDFNFEDIIHKKRNVDLPSKIEYFTPNNSNGSNFETESIVNHNDEKESPQSKEEETHKKYTAKPINTVSHLSVDNANLLKSLANMKQDKEIPLSQKSVINEQPEEDTKKKEEKESLPVLKEGDFVEVLGGRRKGFFGYVTKVRDRTANIFIQPSIEIIKQSLLKKSKYLEPPKNPFRRKLNFTNSHIVDIEPSIKLVKYDVFCIPPDTRPLFVRREGIQLYYSSFEDDEEIPLTSQMKCKKLEPPESVLDFFGNPVKKGDKINVRNGSHKGESGIIRVIYGNKVFVGFTNSYEMLTTSDIYIQSENIKLPFYIKIGAIVKLKYYQIGTVIEISGETVKIEYKDGNTNEFPYSMLAPTTPNYKDEVFIDDEKDSEGIVIEVLQNNVSIMTKNGNIRCLPLNKVCRKSQK